MPDIAAIISADPLMPDETSLNASGLVIPLFSAAETLPLPIGVGQGLGALAICCGSGVVLRDREEPPSAAA
jgi:hypothetical protein